MPELLEHLSLWYHKKEALIPHASPLIVLSVILITGYVFTRISKKVKVIPLVTFQIIGGILLGHYVFNIFSEHAYSSFGPITDFALGFIGLTIGSHLDFRKLHNAGRRIVFITLTDVIITPTLVFSALYFIAGVQFEIALIISVISIVTAPGSTIHVVNEKRAKGIFTKTLLAVVALNNVITILIFYTVYYILDVRGATGGDVSIIAMISRPLILLAESVFIGAVVGFGLIYITEKHKTGLSFLALVILAIVVAVGTSKTLHFSSILSCLILGLVLTNFSKYKNTLFGAFVDIEKEVFSLFFVLAGTHLDFKAMITAGFAGTLLILSRLIGKTFAPVLGAFMANSTQTIKKWIGFSLYPIAGVAIGLVLLCETIPSLQKLAPHITAIVLTAVVVNEILGPIFTGFAIKKAGEENKNRMRLMDFLQEEYIKLDLKAKDKWAALEELSEFMYKTHKIHEVTQAQFAESVIKREKEISTGIGSNIAIPHAIVKEGPKIRGVIGIFPEGINFEALDGQEVYVVILIATPRGHQELHLKVLANIAKIFSYHPYIKDKIIKAKTPEAVFEILQAEEVEELNPFFED